MTDGFDVVSVRIEDERAIVVRVIVRAKARWAIVSSSGCHRRFIKRIDELPRVRVKRNVAASAVQRSLPDPEIGFGRNGESRVAAELHPYRITDRRDRATIQ